MRPNSQPDAPGTIIANRYRVEQLLGRGGMAMVYRVRDQRTGQELALKRTLASDGRRRQRYQASLEREYYTLAQLAHPRIIAVYDYGVDPTGPYYTMELLDGADLEREDRMPWQRTCALLCDVASSLALLHSRGLVHRDVSARNVRRTADGRAKLIDFGAMMSMAVAKDVVGTAPFLAPEALQLQALDGRADLYSLGALGYRLLTGRHAFAAKRLRELRDLWRTRPTAPAALSPEVPSELSALILQLLTLDRAGRPHAAAEVIERLCAIADLPRDDAPEVSRAYLATPALVGRDGELLRVRKRVLGLVRGDGGALLIRGDSGSGRSRMLDACALEGKLLGIAVVRADARDASRGEWGVARALADQLLAEFPQQAFEAARLTRQVLSHVVEEFRGASDEMRTATGYEPERSVLVRELRDWVLSLTKAQRLMLVIDDADRIDDPSAALLSALVHKAEKNLLLLALAVEAGDARDGSPAQDLLQEIADPIELRDLSPSETEALVRSLFGEVPNLPLCALRIHGLSHGNPRAAMTLAQHLVDSRLARYESGSWALPDRLDETDLPTTMVASLAAQLTELSPDARELAEVLALADPDSVPANGYAALTEHGQPKRVFRALDELMSARILIADAERYAFTQRGFIAVLHDCLTPARRSKLHGRIAQFLGSRGGDPLRRAHHLLAAGYDDQGIALLCQIDFAEHEPPIELLSRAIERGERLLLPAATLHRLRVGIVLHAPFTLDYEQCRRVVPVVLTQLERDSGLTRYRELATLSSADRLAQALAQTQEAYDNTPEEERVHAPFEALRELARVSGAIASIVTTTFDQSMLGSLPSLEPFFPLSRGLSIVALVVDACQLWVQGRLLRAKSMYENILARLAEPDRGGLDEAQHDRVFYGLQYGLGLLEAVCGSEASQHRAKLLDDKRELRVNAWRVRALLDLARGDSEGWIKSSRRAQLLQAQEGLRERYLGATAGVELALQHRLGDMIAVKRVLDQVSRLARAHSCWQAVELFGRAAYAELQHDPDAALSAIETALALAPPLQLPFYSSLVSCRINVLVQLGRAAEAAEHARRDVAFCDAHDVFAQDLRRFGALALTIAGDAAHGLAMWRASLESAQRLHSVGYSIGAVYETGLRIAIELRDMQLFEECRQACVEQLEQVRNVNVNAKLAGLYELARVRGLIASDMIEAAIASRTIPAEDDDYEVIHSRIAECLDGVDRGRCALTLLLQDTVTPAGLLYTSDNNYRLTLLAALPDVPESSDTTSWLTHVVTDWLEAVSSDVTESVAADATETSALDSNVHTHVDADGKHWQAVPLVCDRVSSRVLAGVLVLQVEAAQVITLPPALTANVARELLEHGDAEGRPVLMI